MALNDFLYKTYEFIEDKKILTKYALPLVIGTGIYFGLDQVMENTIDSAFNPPAAFSAAMLTSIGYAILPNLYESLKDDVKDKYEKLTDLVFDTILKIEDKIEEKNSDYL